MSDSQSTSRRCALWGTRFSWKRKAVFACSVTLFTVFTLLFYAPLEVYLGNITDFNIPFRYVWRILLGAAALGTVALSLVQMLLPERVFWGVSLTVFGLGLCSYVQAIFLNAQMGTLTGEDEIYGTALVVVNLLIWLALLAALFVLGSWLARRDKRPTFMSAVTFVALALMTMQGTALISQWAGTDMTIFSKESYLSCEGEFEVSSGENVIEFIVDTCDTAFFQEALTHYPDMTDCLRGFTYYPNTTSTHSRTYPSVPYLLTGEICYFDKPMATYVQDAWDNSTFISGLKNANCDVRLFTPNVYISKDAMHTLVDNVEGEPEGMSNNVSMWAMIGQMSKLSLYRDAPYLLKPYFRYEGDEVSRAISRLSLPAIEQADAAFYESLTKTDRLKATDNYDKAFRFYHMFGAHAGSRLGEDATNSNTTKDQNATIRGCMRIIEEYITQLKALGVYEQSTIIITADHGFSGGSDNLEAAWTYRPVMIVKPAGVGDDAPMATSQAPISHADLFATIYAGLGQDTSAYGQPVWEIAEDDPRERYYYYTALRSDEEGEVALREYRITGDAGNLNNWALTGRDWDVLYSERAISKQRLKK